MLDCLEKEIEVDEKAAMFNLALLSSIATWALEQRDLEPLFPHMSANQLKKAQVQMNRDTVRVVMLVLSIQCFATGQPQSFSLRQLAKAIDEPRIESMQRTLRNWLLPMLSQAGLIDGFVLTTTWSTEPHEITITSKGLNLMKSYFGRLTQTSPLFQ